LAEYKSAVDGINLTDFAPPLEALTTPVPVAVNIADPS
jgi:aconitate hydratase 2/2-methylisocitrate dehydratase